MRKEVRELIEFAAENGFTYEGVTGSGHCRLRHTGGQMLILPSSPNGGRRSTKNSVSLIRRIHSSSKDMK